MKVLPRGIKGPVRHAVHYGDLPLDELGAHHVILYAEGDAPQDDAAFCVLEVASSDVAARLATVRSLRPPRREAKRS